MTQRFGQLPVVLDGEGVVYKLSLPAGQRLHLTGPVIAKIFLGQITNWNDPAIAALNPGIHMPDGPITVVRRGGEHGRAALARDAAAEHSRLRIIIQHRRGQARRCPRYGRFGCRSQICSALGRRQKRTRRRTAVVDVYSDWPGRSPDRSWCRRTADKAKIRLPGARIPAFGAVLELQVAVRGRVCLGPRK